MKKGFEVKEPVIRGTLAVVIIAIGLTLAGCGEEMARMQDEQLRLQAIIDNNTLQIAALGKRIEQNRNEQQAGIEEVQNDIRQVAANTAAVSEEQMTEVASQDREALDLAAAGDAEGFLASFAPSQNARRVCSVACMYAALRCLPSLGVDRGRVLHYAQSIHPSQMLAVTHASVAFP